MKARDYGDITIEINTPPKKRRFFSIFKSKEKSKSSEKQHQESILITNISTAENSNTLKLISEPRLELPTLTNQRSEINIAIDDQNHNSKSVTCPRCAHSFSERDLEEMLVKIAPRRLSDSEPNVRRNLFDSELAGMEDFSRDVSC